MGTLSLVRHGQASTLEGDYDKLSQMGVHQSRRLGEYWAAQGMAPDHVFVGPRRRHEGTYRNVLDALGELGNGWPEPEYLHSLDELPGEELLTEGLAKLAEGNDGLGLRAKAVLDSLGQDDRDVPEMLAVFRAIIERWAMGKLTLPGVETWNEFGTRVKDAMDTMTQATGKGEQTLAFTSGGFTGLALGQILGMNAETTVRQMWPIQNSSVTVFRVQGAQLTLGHFNTVPHLREPSEHTLV